MKREISAIASVVLTTGAILLSAVSVKGEGVRYATRMLEYRPAPTQFANLDMSLHPQAALGAVDAQDDVTDEGVVTLGGFGGYIVLGFDAPVKNDPRHRYGVDFTIVGNTVSSTINGASCEPAAVMVMKDLNGNGLPDDGEWYELAGSDYYFGSTRRGLTVEYVNPMYTNAHTVGWTSSDGVTGGVLAVGAHNQPYYPDPYLYAGIPAEGMTAGGNCIMGSPDGRNPNGVNFYRSPAFGYADSHPAAPKGDYPHNPYFPDERGAVTDGFDISWAVDAQGNSVELDEIDFVKIYTAGLANLGWLGEWSAEIAGVVVSEPDEEYVAQDFYLHYICVTQPTVALGGSGRFEGMLFKNGAPCSEGTPRYRVEDESVGTISDDGVFTPLKEGRTKISFQAKEGVPADEVDVTVTSVTGVLCTLTSRATASATAECIVGEKLYIPMESTDNIKEVVPGASGDRYVYDSYTWYNTDPTVGTVDKWGTFTALSVGSTVVSAVSDSNPACYAEVKVTVKDVPAIAPVKKEIVIPADITEGSWTTADLLRSTNKSTVLLEDVTTRDGKFDCHIEGNRVVYNLADAPAFEDEMLLTARHYGRQLTFTIVVSYDPDLGAMTSPLADRIASEEVWYTIGGLRLPAEPTLPGIYIVNGEKRLKH